MEGWSLNTEAPALSDFYFILKQKNAFLLAHSRKRSNAFEDARF